MKTKKIASTLLALTLVAGGVLIVAGPAAEAKKKKKKKPPALVQVDQKFFLHSAGCPAAGGNFDYLSITDSDDEVQCFYTAAGIRNEVGNSTGTIGAQGQNAVSDRATATRYWDTTDGAPVVLDATKPLTASIWSSGGQCPAAGACSPAGVTAGEVILDVTVVGMQGDTEVELGTFSETFQTTPGTVHLSEVKIDFDAALNGQTFDTIDFRTWVHGKSAGHGVINTNGETSSFVTIPVLAAAS